MGLLDDAAASIDAPHRPSADEPALVAAALRRDGEAMAQLYRRFAPRVYAFALRRCGAREVAEDVTSATFERAVRYLGSFDPRRQGGFGPWLLGICARELAEHHRKEQRAAPRVPDDPGWTVDDVDRVDVGDDMSRMFRALGRLHPRYQQVISLRYLAGLSPEDAAHALGTSKPVVAVTLHRAMTALRRGMERS